MLKRLLVFVLCMVPAVSHVSASMAEEQEIENALMEQIAGFAGVILQEKDPSNPRASSEKIPEDDIMNSCYPLAFLYRTEHPLNPYYGDKKIRDAAFAYCDHIAACKTGLEWPLYNLCMVYNWLKDEIAPERKKKWLEYVEYYVSHRGIRPYFYTSFNHEAWNCLAVFKAGQVFGRPEWEDQGRRMMHQLMKVQTELGFFEEGPHHGPSMKYNQVQLGAMIFYAELAKDDEVMAAAEKLADFMIRYSFPDGSPIGCLDGRQSWSLGYFGTLCQGFDRWPQGKEINRRIYRTRKKWGVLDPEGKHFNLSNWYAYFGYAFLMDEYLSLLPDAPTQSVLPQDRNGYLMVEKGTNFDGGVARQHDWMVAISAINSDVPRIANDIYRLDRQNRLDVWHEKTGLIIGGGHNKIDCDMPLANVVLLTGYNDVACDFGLLSGGRSTASGDRYHDWRAVYIPRALSSEITLDKQVLTEHFGQGDITLAVRPVNENRLDIGYRYDVFTTRELFIQLPLIVFYNSRVKVDGELFDNGSPVTVDKQVEISNPTMGATVRFTTPVGSSAKLQPGVWPMRWYIGEHVPNQRYEPYYKINLLSVKIDIAGGKGAGTFVLEITE
ncbi:MAG: hypothetical protein U9P14_05635 [Gemmatimonadota bacterium]|nr:hypothetical protein [Gemmatimonadota bacterium]